MSTPEKLNALADWLQKAGFNLDGMFAPVSSEFVRAIAKDIEGRESVIPAGSILDDIDDLNITIKRGDFTRLNKELAVQKREILDQGALINKQAAELRALQSLIDDQDLPEPQTPLQFIVDCIKEHGRFDDLELTATRLFTALESECAHANAMVEALKNACESYENPKAKSRPEYQLMVRAIAIHEARRTVGIV